jgi:glycosyltransferase involved in cell wall biosynthesis
VRHGVDGLVVKGDGVPELAEALERLMKDDEERKKFASRAPQIVERFSMQAALQQWDELLSLFHTR